MVYGMLYSRAVMKTSLYISIEILQKFFDFFYFIFFFKTDISTHRHSFQATSHFLVIPSI